MTVRRYERDYERRATSNIDPQARPARAENQPHTCYYCGQLLAGPVQDYICPEKPKTNATH